MTGDKLKGEPDRQLAVRLHALLKRWNYEDEIACPRERRVRVNTREFAPVRTYLLPLISLIKL